MDTADDRPGPPLWWSTTSPAELDRLACGVLRAARDAARELRREPFDPARRTWALGILAGRTKAMLGPDMPDHPPLDTTAQEEFVRLSLALALHVRAHSWAEADLGAVGVRGQEDVPHPGELLAADAFDVLGRLLLPHAGPEAWTATLVTDLASGDKALGAVVKLGKYALHPTFLGFTDDTTRVIGEALRALNVRELFELAESLWACAWGLDLGPDLEAALEELLAPPTPDDDLASHPGLREEVQLDELRDEEGQQPLQPGAITFCLDDFGQGPGEITPETDPPGPEDLNDV
ncbi:hypothetical protein ACWD4F_31815 [Streptomyces aureus]